MKKILALAMSMALLLTACGGGGDAPESSQTSGGSAVQSGSGDGGQSGYTVRVYSDVSREQADWLVRQAGAYGFTISVEARSNALQAAARNGDGDMIFGLNDARWCELVKGEHEGLEIADWAPEWSGDVGGYAFPGKAYGLTAQNVLMFYRTDALGTNGEELHFDHWADIVDCGYVWYRQNKADGAIASHANTAMLYAFVDPGSPAGGVSVDGWKALWKYCAQGRNGGEDYYLFGFDPLNKGDVQVSTFYSSSMYEKIDIAGEISEDPLLGTMAPKNWAVADIAEGTYYITKYVGILEREGRSEAETEAVKEFAQWLGSAETQVAWSEVFDTFPCNTKAAEILYPNGIPNIYRPKNFATAKVDGDTIYAGYVADHSEQWANIMTDLGFFWDYGSEAPAEPDWDSLDWTALTRDPN